MTTPNLYTYTQSQTPVQSLVPSTNDMNTLQLIARTAASSQLYAGVGSEQKILMILLAAQEMGVKPMMALNGGIWNIQGKIEISSRLMSSMIRRAGHSITIKECNSKVCILEGKRADNGDTFVSQFSIEDANKAGLSNRDVWKKYTEDMLYNRAMSRLARRLFADVIGTAYVEGEIRDAEVEIVKNDINFEEPQPIPTDPQIEESILNEFVKGCNTEFKTLVPEFIKGYAKHYGKTIAQACLEDYSDVQKFERQFNSWCKKNSKTPVAA